MIPEAVLGHMEENEERYLGELACLSGIQDATKTAEWLLGQTTQLGFSGTLYDTPGQPLVYAGLCPHEDAPILLVYGRYDARLPGMPVKFLKAIESVIAVDGRLPLNVRLLFRGDGDTDNARFETFLRERRELLKADIVACIDAPGYSKDVPAIYYSMKGAVTVRLDVSGPLADLSVSRYGGAVANPALALARIISTLKDSDGCISIPGFYDLAWDPHPQDIKEIEMLQVDEASVIDRTGPDTIVPEAGYSALECMMLRPTLDVCGIWGGAASGETREIIPATAGALISMRLVPAQDPEVIFKLFEAHVHAATPPGISVKVSNISGIEPFVVPRNSPVINAAAEAVELGFGLRPALVRTGESLSNILQLKRALGVSDIVILGMSDPRPGDHFSPDRFRRGIVTAAALIYGLATAKKHQPLTYR